MTEQQYPQKPISFKELTYNNRNEVNYLDDISGTGPQYALFLQSLNYNQTAQIQRSHFNSIADDLYKKIVKQGYVDRPSKVAKKSKKGDAEVNFYNTNDSFIDDQDCCVQKKDKTSSFEDFSSVQINSIEELYSSPQYKKLREELIVEEGKRKAEQFNLDIVGQKERFDQMRKTIKNFILGRQPKLVATENGNNEPTFAGPNEQTIIQILDQEGSSQQMQLQKKND